MKRCLVALSLLVSLAVLVPAGQARLRTTEPAEEVDVYVTLRDSGIQLSREDAPRGAVVRFIVHNLGTKPHSFALAKKHVTAVRTGLATPPLKPRTGVKILLIFLDFRGELGYRSTVPTDLKHPRMRGVFRIT